MLEYTITTWMTFFLATTNRETKAIINCCNLFNNFLQPEAVVQMLEYTVIFFMLAIRTVSKMLEYTVLPFLLQPDARI